jgi:hypothetical protein
MKKLLILILVVSPLISIAQHSINTDRPLVICFDDSSAFKKFEVPSGTWLRIVNIYSEAEQVKLKVSVKEKLSANQSAFVKTLVFNRKDLMAFSLNGIFFPAGSVIEYDGVPILIFCYLNQNVT